MAEWTHDNNGNKLATTKYQPQMATMAIKLPVQTNNYKWQNSQTAKMTTT
jgi:hypothetical protein